MISEIGVVSTKVNGEGVLDWIAHCWSYLLQPVGAIEMWAIQHAEGSQVQVGIIGLGKMGNQIRSLARAGGIDAIGYDRNEELSDVPDLDALLDRLVGVRTIWLMLPEGGPTDQTIEYLASRLRPGDLVIDGGNSNFHDSIDHAGRLGSAEVSFLDVGVSGGIHGIEAGFCLMVGGPASAVRRAQPIFDILMTPGGFVHVSESHGSGHYAKMIHNAVEYGMMQALAEGYELLEKSPLGLNVPATIGAWRNGSVVRSWLLDLLSETLEQNADLSQYPAYAPDSGEGRWSIKEAIDLAVPTPVISAALHARLYSRGMGDDSHRAIAALRHAFGGHPLVSGDS